MSNSEEAGIRRKALDLEERRLVATWESEVIRLEGIIADFQDAGFEPKRTIRITKLLKLHIEQFRNGEPLTPLKEINDD